MTINHLLLALLLLQSSGISYSKNPGSGHSGAPPVVSACGTSPSIVGNDIYGKVTTGSGPLASCTLTFATAFSSSSVACTANSNQIESLGVVTTASTLTITGTDITSNVISYVCGETP